MLNALLNIKFKHRNTISQSILLPKGVNTYRVRLLASCFATVQAGVLALCIAIMIFDSDLLSVLEEVAVWAIVQPVILPIALLYSPIGALLRMCLALGFAPPAKVALPDDGH